jgi:hypothetical protein
LKIFSVGKVMLHGCGPQECAEVLQSSAVISLCICGRNGLRPLSGGNFGSMNVILIKCRELLRTFSSEIWPSISGETRDGDSGNRTSIYEFYPIKSNYASLLYL